MKKYCDYLIVGVCSDEHIRISKHHEPIMKEYDRLRIISALKIVDKVLVVQEKDIENKLEFCKQNKINIIFAGSDWLNDERYNKIKNDGKIEVMFFPYTKGILSTIIKEKIHNENL